MKCWTITDRRAERGIALVEGKIVLGESGRGRSFTRAATPTGAVIDGDRVVEVAGTGALVRVPGLHGFRGTARTYRAPADPMLPCDEDGDVLAPLAHGIVADGDAGNMASSVDALYRLAPGEALQIVRHGRLYGGPKRIRVVAGEDGYVRWIDIAAYRAVIAAELAIEDATEAMPGATEAVIEWHPAPSSRRRNDPPTLLTADGARHTFAGASIPGVVEVIRDRSDRGGMARYRVERFDVVLAAGVSVIPGTSYKDGVPEEDWTAPAAAAPAPAPVPADVAAAQAAGNPFAALAGLK